MKYLITIFLLVSSATILSNPIEITNLKNNKNFCVDEFLELNFEIEEAFNDKFYIELESENILLDKSPLLNAATNSYSFRIYEDFTKSPIAVSVFRDDAQKLIRYEGLNLQIFPRKITIEQIGESCEGEDLELRAITNGGTNLRYTWFFNGLEIYGEDKPNLILENSNFGMSGNYSCSVESECGILRSEQVSLYIQPLPEIILQPEDQFYSEGSRARFEASVHFGDKGSGNYTYQWYKDGEAIQDNNRIAGAFSNILTITNLKEADLGVYYLKVSTNCGEVTSDKVQLIDLDFFDMEKISGDFDGCESLSSRFRLKVDQLVEGKVSYQWYKTGFNKIIDDERISGSTTPTLFIDNIQKSDEQDYYCMVTNEDYGYSERSPRFRVTVKSKPNVLRQSNLDYKIYDLNLGPNYGTINLFVNSPGNGNLYEWYHEGVFKSDNKSISIGNPDVFEDNLGKWWCIISNECGTTTSDTINVSLGNREVVTCVGEQITLEIDNSNFDNDDYEFLWLLDDSTNVDDLPAIANIYDNRLHITSSMVEHYGNYYVYGISKSEGDTTLLGTILFVVKDKPYIIKDLPKTLTQKERRGKLQTPFTLLVIQTLANSTFAQLYKDDEPYGDTQLVERRSMMWSYPTFYMGGMSNPVPPGKYYWHIWNECGEEYSNTCEVIQPKTEFAPITSINSSQNEDLLVYPNPSSDKFIIQNFSNDFLKSISLVNMLGEELLFIDSIEQSSAVVDVSDIENGIYILKIKYKNSIVTKKIQVLR